MKLTCSQMDVLLSFYINGDLSTSLKTQVEEHMSSCASCRAKFDIVKNMLEELKQDLKIDNKASRLEKENHSITSEHYRAFSENLSAYIDNELTNEENIKLKKFTINNSTARKDLENAYQLRKLMNDSLKKAKSESKQDFSKNVLKQLELEDEIELGIHPAIKLLIVFTILVLTITAIVLMNLRV